MNRRLRRDERGTSLLIVLMIITFVSTVTGVILSQEGTSVRATEALQDQSAGSYGADAAGQAIVTQLKNGQFGCSTTTGSSVNLGNGAASPFYRASGTNAAPMNATATCTPDTTTGVTVAGVTGTGNMVGPANTPSAAITTVGSGLLDGIFAVTPTFLCVQGNVLSYTSITGITQVGQSSTGSATACPDTVNPAVTVKAFGNPLQIPIIPGCVGVFRLTQCVPLGTSVPPIAAVPDPGAAITATNPAAVCQTSGGKTYAAFLPGLYNQVTSTKASSLSTPCASGSKWVAANVEWFTPGVYYFDYGPATWTLPASLVGGTPANASGQAIAGLNATSRATLTASTLSNLSQMPTGEGKCIPPNLQTQPGPAGVEFVFGGSSTMTVNPPPSVTVFGVPILTGTTGGDMDICASYSSTSPPVAIYGVYQHALTEGGITVSPESGCVTQPVGTLGCVTTQSLINAPSLVGDQTFHIDGFVWAPAAALTVSYLSATGQAFNWGVLVRTFQVAGLPLPSLTMASVPTANAGRVTTYAYSIRYVNVWTCAAASSPCAQTGPPNLRIKLQQLGTTWKVLSWSQQR